MQMTSYWFRDWSEEHIGPLMVTAAMMNEEASIPSLGWLLISLNNFFELSSLGWLLTSLKTWSGFSSNRLVVENISEALYLTRNRSIMVLRFWSVNLKGNLVVKLKEEEVDVKKRSFGSPPYMNGCSPRGHL